MRCVADTPSVEQIAQVGFPPPPVATPPIPPAVVLVGSYPAGPTYGPGAYYYPPCTPWSPTLAWLPHSQQARSRLVHCRQLAPEMPPAPYPCRFQPPKTSQMPVSTPCTCALQTPTPSSARLLNDAQMRDTLWYHLDCPRPGAAVQHAKQMQHPPHLPSLLEQRTAPTSVPC